MSTRKLVGYEPNPCDPEPLPVYEDQFSAAAPQPAAQPEQPEPGVLTDARISALWDESKSTDAGAYAAIRAFARAIEREVLAATRKRTAEQNARIMEAVKLAISNKASVHEVERLLKGEA